jgi:hypothetical protein
MRQLTRLSLLGAIVLGAAAFTNPAFGARPSPLAFPNTVGSTHFLVHFQSDMVGSPQYAITQTQAGDIAGYAERALSAELADGYPAPLSDVGVDGDPRIDIYVDDLTGTGALAYAQPDTWSSPDTGYIVLAGNDPADALTEHVVAHELFHLVQFGIWLSANDPADFWLYEGTAEWMGYRVDGYAGNFELGPSDMSLDCRDPFGTQECNTSDDYMNNGYSRWPFFEYLSEKFGASFEKDVFAQGAAGAPTATAALANAIAAKGTTLADVFNAWSTAQMTGGYTVAALQTTKPDPYAAVSTGTTSGPLPVQRAAVNHLAVRYIEFDPGDGDATAACYQATLALTVTIPAGTLSKPTFYWDGLGSTPVPLSINGSTATASIPWNTCTWEANEGMLSLPNASQNVDSADFVVTSTLTVDTTKPANATTAPTPVSVWGQVVPVPAAELPPSIYVYGPELLTLSASDKQLRIIVESSGDGSLQATIGSTSLGAGALRAGNNDLRFTLPASLLVSLRQSADASNILTLTPVAISGGAKGQPVTRQVLIQANTTSTKPATKPATKHKAKAKPVTKHKTKAKPKPKHHK